MLPDSKCAGTTSPFQPKSAQEIPIHEQPDSENPAPRVLLQRDPNPRSRTQLDRRTSAGITNSVLPRNCHSITGGAGGADAHFVELDVTKPLTIAKAAEQIRTQFGKLDILVNNAGVVAKGDGPPSVADPDAVRQVLEINFFGVLAVTQAMLPLVRNAASGRIVMVSSGLGSLTWNADPNWSFAAFKPLGYNGSKAILNMMTVRLAWELRDTPIKVNTVNPGYTATDINGNSGTQTIEEGAVETVRQSLAPDDAPTGAFFETGGVVPW